jgi:PKHD-type hydroxylase
MMRHLRNVLTPEQVRRCNDVLSKVAWIDGRTTAGDQSRQVKQNLQIAEDSAEARALGEVILSALASNPQFISAALPLRIYPPLFNRYARGMSFGNHIDGAVRQSPVTGARYRTDLSCTLFLTSPDEFDGGELVIEGELGPRSVKLPAGDMILYPATTVHRVEPVTRGERWAAFFWVQSMVAEQDRRDLLHDLDEAIAATRGDLGDAHPAAVSLVGVYHNLVRMWARL